ncbi:hypothetical protein ACVMGF_001273 [Bradyrhizobium diazoefficiens]
MLVDVLHQCRGGGGIGDVGDMDRAVSADGRARRVQRIRAARSQRDLRSLGGKGNGNGKADAAAGAGDEGDAIVELELHRIASSIQPTVMSRYLASAPAWSPSAARAVCRIY